MRRSTLALFGVLILLWGSSFAVVKIGLGESPPVLFAGFRAILGGFAMLCVAWFFGGEVRFRENLGVYAVLTLLNVVLFIAFQTFAILMLTSGLAAVLVYLQPILVGILAWYVLGERLTSLKVAGLGLGFGGIVVVSAGGVLGGGSAGISPAGVVFGVLSAFSWAAGTVYFKKVQERVSSLWSVAISFFVGGVVLSLLGISTESVGDIDFGTVYFLSLACSALMGSSVSWLIWFALVRAGEASRVAAYIFAVPVTAVIVGVIALGEEPGVSLVIGGILVGVGIYTVNRTPPDAERKPEDAIG